MNKKILFYTDCFFLAGCENVLINIFKSNVIQENYNITLVYRYSVEYENGLKDKQIDKVNIVPKRLLSNDGIFYRLRLKFQNRVLYRLLILPLFLVQKTGIYNIINFFLLLKLFKKIDPDILFINNGGYPAARSCLVGVFSAKSAKINKIIFCVNNLATIQNGFFDSFVDRQIGKMVDIFVTASYYAGNKLSENRRFPDTKLRRIANTLFQEKEIVTLSGKLRAEFGLNKNQFTLGSAGLLTQRKGYSFFIKACFLIKNELFRRQAKVFIFGDGEERENLENLIKKYNLEDIVFLPGYRPDILEYIKDMDVFVLPSIDSEDFPYVNLEAMIQGKPLIGCNVAGISEQIEQNETGVLVEPKNEVLLANAIKRFLNDTSLSKKMGIKGKEKYFNEFSYTSTMRAYMDLFQELM
jgi:glycosyltransferase involved in cell wall biosynthesis